MRQLSKYQEGQNWKERTKNEETGYQDDQVVDFLKHGSCYGPWSNGSQQEPFCPTLTPEVTLQFLKTFLVADATAPGAKRPGTPPNILQRTG